MRCLFLLFLALTLSAAEGKKDTLPPHKTEIFQVAKSIPYADDATGLSFPVRFGSFEKWKVRRNAHPLIGTMIRYLDPKSGSGDIFIYQLEMNGERDITFEQTREEWKRLEQKMLQQKDFSLIELKEKGTVLADGKVIGCYAGSEIAFKGIRCFSEMLLVARRDLQIRIRVTVLSEQASVSRKFMNDVLELLFAGEKISMQKTAVAGN